jgi:hypothetical protein
MYKMTDFNLEQYKLINISNDKLGDLFKKDNTIYNNNIDEIEIFDEVFKDLAKEYVNNREFNTNIHHIYFEFMPLKDKNKFIEYCYKYIIDNNILNTAYHYLSFFKKKEKELIAYYMLATLYIVNKY